MIFVGMKPPPLDETFVEIETEDGSIVDLYNEHYLRSVEIRGGVLEFNFEATDASTTAVLTFLGVRGLGVVQPEVWHEGEADQIEDLLVRREGPWRRVVFKAGGFAYEFDSAELRISVEVVPKAPKVRD